MIQGPQTGRNLLVRPQIIPTRRYQQLRQLRNILNGNFLQAAVGRGLVHPDVAHRHMLGPIPIARAIGDGLQPLKRRPLAQDVAPSVHILTFPLRPVEPIIPYAMAAIRTTSTPIQLRRADLGDLEAIAKLERQCFRTPWPASAIAYDLERSTRGESLYLVATHNGQVLGYIGAWLVADEAHIGTLGVDPNYRRQGIADRLLTELLDQVRKLGCKIATLEVRVSNLAAQVLYCKHGFINIGRRRGYYQDTHEDALLFEKELVET